ncbi:hypothetical protein BXZ70DRAFT_961904 [Cristinia sonorae]|uniref:Uncharacterized protein n=1 Tax=Cristinia sonorae TaxID=1940300 RepID=A0A8K0XKG3_9AGAR|nr:hypothetical protein BXZ70DRAFT_961904 [Cristinia sonorae]
MPPARHFLEGNPGSGLDDPFPRERLNYRYRIVSVDTPRSHTSFPSFQSITHSTPKSLFSRAITAEAIYDAPPAYVPTEALHAATLAPDAEDPSLDPSNWPAAQPTPLSPAELTRHRTSPGIIVVAILISAIVALSVAVTAIVLIKKKHIRIRIPIPTFLQRHSLEKKINSTKHWKTLKLTPSGSSNSELVGKRRHSDLLRRTTSIFQYVHITHDDEESSSSEMKALEGHPAATISLSPTVRRHSSPALSSNSASGTPLDSAARSPRPASLPPTDREAALLVQQQKLSELDQIERMKTLHDKSFARQSVKGLGIVQDDAEVDIGNTVLAALQHYKLSAGKSMSMRTSLIGLPTSVSHPESFDSSIRSSTLSRDFEEDVAEIATARTQSMEIQKGVLVTLNSDTSDIPQLLISTPSTVASRRVFSSPQLTGHISPRQDYLQPMRPYPPPALDSHTSSDALNETPDHFSVTPPPMLSPIIPSSFGLSAEIEKSLEERVFAYRQASREKNKLIPQGSARVAEVLGIRRSNTYHDQPVRAWPWPTIKEVDESEG